MECHFPLPMIGRAFRGYGRHGRRGYDRGHHYGRGYVRCGVSYSSHSSFSNFHRHQLSAKQTLAIDVAQSNHHTSVNIDIHFAKKLISMIGA